MQHTHTHSQESITAYQSTEHTTLHEWGKCLSLVPGAAAAFDPIAPIGCTTAHSNLVSVLWRYKLSLSASTCKLMTSRRVAGVLETYWTQSWPSAVHSRGGKMELRMSSVCVSCFCSTGGSLP